MISKEQEIGRMLLLLSENFSAEISESMGRLLLKKLSPFPLERVRAGLEQILLTRKYKGFPTLAEILEAVKGGPEGGDIEALAEDQWALLLETIGRVGPYESVQFADPSTGAAVREMGGWAAVCAWSNEDIKYRRKDFVATYRAATRSGRHRIESLPGLHELANGQRHLSETPPARQIGGGAALAVVQGGRS